jgi:hypothetical protein
MTHNNNNQSKHTLSPRILFNPLHDQPPPNNAQKNRPRGLSYSAQKELDDETKLQKLYTACSDLTMYHDLRCGHRVLSTSLSESCAITCKKPGRAAPFVCEECVGHDVRLEMEFEGINLIANSGELIQAIADKEVAQRYALGNRRCKLTEKFEDPRLQFFNEFFLEDGHGGLNDIVEPTETLGCKLKRPGVWKGQDGRAAKKGRGDAWAPREVAVQVNDEEEEEVALPSLAEMQQDWEFLRAQFAKGAGARLEAMLGDGKDMYIEPLPEDDAMEAVRQALGRMGV